MQLFVKVYRIRESESGARAVVGGGRHGISRLPPDVCPLFAKREFDESVARTGGAKALTRVVGAFCFLFRFFANVTI